MINYTIFKELLILLYASFIWHFPEYPKMQSIQKFLNTAEVIGVEPAVATGGYVFNVTIRSPDTGCDQYADWWELLDQNGNLLYRRILLHSHVSEQPFTRAGEVVSLSGDQTVIVRVHMNNSGYSTSAMKGAVTYGFQKITLPENYFNNLEKEKPLPEGCAF
jgi:hypothetical protein